MNDLRLAIVTCTNGRNRAIRNFISSVDALDYEGVQLRLVLVDNNKESQRGSLLNDNLRVPITYVHEDRPGLSRARNAGLARIDDMEWVFFTDDDIVLPRNCIRQIQEVIKLHPAAALIGGRVDLYNPADFPITISRETRCMELGDDEAAFFGFIHGCCMLVPPETRTRIGNFDQGLGAGTSVRSAEDTDYQYRAKKECGPVVYNPALRVFHDHGRRNLKHMRAIRRGWALGQGALAAKYLVKGDTHVLKRLIWQYWNACTTRTRQTGVLGEVGPMAEWVLFQQAVGGLRYLSSRLFQKNA